MEGREVPVQVLHGQRGGGLLGLRPLRGRLQRQNHNNNDINY